MSIHAIESNIDPVQQAKIDLAASLRLAVYHQLEEGIDNHFTVTLPGFEDRFLVLPFGLHWSEAKASDMIVFNEAGETLEDTLVGITSAEIVEAYVDDHTLSITAKFVSEQINATRDENGDVIDGNPNAIIDVTDFWTFARDAKSKNPNWNLVATSSLE